MIRFYISLSLFWATFFAVNGYLESVAASVVGGAEDVSVVQSEPHSALVAFQCGYKNRYFTKDGGGNWVTDNDPRAGCLKGKLDILKYCRKVYPDLRITNIVEAGHDFEIPNWCKLDGQLCKWTFKVRPYRCVVGKFESEALLVPERCHFGHVDDRKLCKDFDYWNQTAQQECEKRRPQPHVIKSFAMLEPCGLDMFAGVEFVCCPSDPKAGVNSGSSDEPTIDLKVKVKLDDEKNKAVDDDEDDSSDEDDDDDDDEDSQEDGFNQTVSKNGSQSVKKRVLPVKIPDLTIPTTTINGVTTTASDDQDSDSDEDDNSPTEDPYFRIADPDREYMIYRGAIDRVEKRHKEKVAEALRKLADAEAKYQQGSDHDAARLEEMKTEFRRTMSSLGKEHHDERHRVDQVHELRVSATLNERKRQAMKSYRQALTPPDGRPQANKVLKALQAYVRAEEKDRMHALNRYRFLLRTDGEEAANVKSGLVKKLHDIDLRINGTIEMTRDVPGLMEKVKRAIMEFWQAFRDENTPGRVEDALTWIGDPRNGERLLNVYESQFEENFQKEQQQHQILEALTTQKTKESDVRPPVKTLTPVVAELWNGKKDGYIEHEEVKSAHSFALKDSLQHEMVMKEESIYSMDGHHYGYTILAVGAVTVLVALTLGIVLFKKRWSMQAQGFVAVDPMTPEERHVSGMQVNGYENPTYTYFEGGKAA